MSKKHLVDVQAIENEAAIEEQTVEEQTVEKTELDGYSSKADETGVPAFPVSDRTKKEQFNTSVIYTVASVVIYLLAYLPIIIVSLVLGVKCYKLLPYYGVWPFVGTIFAGVLGLVFMTVVLVVERKKSKHSIRTQTVKILIAFVCLTTGMGLLFTYIVPDVIAKATQSTLYCEDVYYKGAEQAEKNAKLERDFIMYNVLNGNLNNYDGNRIADHGDFSYTTLSKREENNGTFIRYYNQDIQNVYDAYMRDYDIKTIKSQVIDVLEKNAPRRYELYNFVYTNYVLNDYDYAFVNNVQRRAFALSLVDYIYSNFDYEGMLKTGFKDARVKALFQANYDSFNHDGYNTFDDPLLLYAQVNGRMTIPVVLRLILNGGWEYSQGGYDDATGEVRFTEDGNCLYQLYDPEKVAEFVANGGEFLYDGKLMDENGNEITVKYGFNEDGWMMYENGVTKRQMKWLVLDMLGDPMSIASVNINALAGDVITTAIQQLIEKLPTLVDALGGLVKKDLIDVVVKEATGGAGLNIGLCFDDDGNLAVNLFSMNAPYGMLGYMQATWVDSDNLLMAVINVVGLRNWLCIFGAIGSVLIIAAGICREMGEKTRNRSEIARDRVNRANGDGTDEETPAENADNANNADVTVGADAPPTPDAV